MACRNAYKNHNVTSYPVEIASVVEIVAPENIERFLFGVDSRFKANEMLQNNIDLFEWVLRNKIYPVFWGRNISGECALTKEEARFIHSKGCKIAAIYIDSAKKGTEEQGKNVAEKMCSKAYELKIPLGTAIFLEIDEEVTKDYLKGLASVLIFEGYTPAFKVNTDAKYGFDREFARGMQSNKEIFSKCLIWATAPTIDEYNGMTTSHLIHPDEWKPYAPSCISRKDIAVWQYGKDCHPIEDDNGNMTTFNLNLIRNEQVVLEKMF